MRISFSSMSNFMCVSTAVLGALVFFCTPVSAAEVLVDGTSVLSRYTPAPASVWVDHQKGFVFYIGAEGDLEMASTTDGGETWSAGRTVDGANATDVVNFAIWWDGWTPTSTSPTTIHVTTVDSGADDSFYTSYNVAANSLGSTTLISTQAASCVVSNNGAPCATSITKSGDGSLYVALQDDVNDRWVMQCVGGNDCTITANWTEITGGVLSTTAGPVNLTPVQGGNNVLLLWRDTSTNVKWAEWSATSSSWHASSSFMSTFGATADNRYTNIATAIATSTGTTTIAIIAQANDYTTQDHDIVFYEWSSTTGTVAKTNVVTNASGGLFNVKIAIDDRTPSAPTYYVMYGRRTVLDGSAFAATSTNIYYRTSSNYGVTWSSEQGPVNDNMDDLAGPFTGMVSNKRIGVWYQYATSPRADDVYHTTIADLDPLVLSGVVYTDAGLTPAPAGVSLSVSIGTSTPSVHTVTTESGGRWRLSSIGTSSITATTPIVVWIDASSTDATTLVSGFGGANITDIPLWYSHVLTYGSSTNTQIPLEQFSNYDRDQDSDILFVHTSTSTTFFNDLVIQRGVLVARSNETVLQGSLTNNASFTHNAGLLRLMGTSESVSGTVTGSSALGNVYVRGSYTMPTTASTSDLVIDVGATLTAPATRLTTQGVFNNLGGTFTHNSGEVVIEGVRSEPLSLAVGRDSSGATSTGSVNIRDFAATGTILYVAKEVNNTLACSQTPSAAGCELMVFDISSTTNPVYVAGRDGDGSAGGSSGDTISDLIVIGNSLFVSKTADPTACSQTAGLAVGCELMVFDISSTTNPVYVAGRDVDGSSAGTSSLSVRAMVATGTSLYLMKSPNATACSQTAGTLGAAGCEIIVFDISSTTNPVYVAGRDANGSSSGSGNVGGQSLAISGTTLYVGKDGSGGTACAQSTGSGATVCELMVFDISSTTNPVYVAGRDASGSSVGTAALTINTIAIKDGYLYAGKVADATACSQTAGSASGCELMVFDISSTTNPVYVGGRDSSVSESGVQDQGIKELFATGTVLFVGLENGSASQCTQQSGFAGGCELQIFNLASSSNPVYVAGVDSAASATGTGAGAVGALAARGGQLLVGGSANSTACSQVPGSAIGCEIIVYTLATSSGVVVGSFVGNSALGQMVATGTVRMAATASTSQLTIPAGSTVSLSGTHYTVTGNYTNNGTMTTPADTVMTFSSNSAQQIAGTLTGTSRLPTVMMSGSGTKTFSNVATTSSLYIQAGATAVAPSSLSVLHTFSNGGTFTAGSDVLSVGTWSGEYVTGIEAGGATAGSISYAMQTGLIVGNVLYTGSSAENTNACSQTAGSASGCELKVFVISSTTNPVYVAGRDTNGSASGSGGVIVNAFARTGNVLYVTKNNAVTPCSQTAGSASGCELMVFDISSTTNPVYVAGRDADGSAGGSIGVAMLSAAVMGNYLYIAKSNSSTACDQAAGSASGCELMVFDISSTTNPVYVAGRDADGSAGGNANLVIYDIEIVGTTLYVAKGGNATPCSQSAGSASGCELMVFDISSTTNPVYVAGRDSVADSGGSGSGAYFSLVASGTVLYVGKNFGSAACSQTAGSSAVSSCELHVYSISSTTNPVYVAGRDASGSSGGTASLAINSITVIGSRLYAGKSGDATACSQTAGSATGCELMVFDVSSTTNPVFYGGRDAGGLQTGIAAVDVNAVVATSGVTYWMKAGDAMTCSSIDGLGDGCELMVIDTESDLTGTLTGTSALGNVTVSGAVRSVDNASTSRFTIDSASQFTAPAQLSVAGNFTNSGSFIGNSGTTTFASSSQQTATGTLTFQHLDVANTSGNGSSTTAVIFGAPLVTAGTFTLRASSSAQFLANSTNTFATVRWNGGSATTSVYLRSSVAGTRWSMSADSFVSTSYINVSNSNNLSTLRVPCYTGCTDSGNNNRWYFTAPVAGSLTLGEHDAEQADNIFSFQNVDDEPLYAFQLVAGSETAVIDDLEFSLYGAQGVTNSELTDLRLYKDQNADGLLDGGDTAVLGTGVLSLLGEVGTITFTSGTTFVSTSTTQNFIITADTVAIDNNDWLTIRLSTSGIDASGEDTLLPQTLTGSVSSLQHIRSNQGGGGENRAPIGGEGPAGSGTKGGGSSSGGSEAGSQTDGANIENDPDFRKPASGSNSTWSSHTDAYESDGVSAGTGSGGSTITLGGFGFAIPATNVIQGITVKVDASGSTAAGTIDVGLSWDGGSSFTSLEATPTLSGSDIVYVLGDQTDLWGRPWTAAQLADALFRVRLTANPSSNTVRLDAVQVRVYHTAGGGGGGGGGEI